MIVADTVLGEANIYSPNAKVLPLSDGGWVAFFNGSQQVFDADGSRVGPTTNYPYELGEIPGNIRATDDGGWAVTFASDGRGDLPRGLYTKTFHVNDINNPPHALSSSGHIFEDQVLHFTANSLQGIDYDGDKIESVEIESLPTAGELRFAGADVHVGDVIAVHDLRKMTWTPQANLSGDDADSFQFKVIDEHGLISTQAAKFHLNITEVNDRPSGGDETITILEDEKHIFTKGDFAFTDPDGNELQGVEVKRAGGGNVTLYVDNIKVRSHFVDLYRDPGQAYFTTGKNEYGDNYATFKTRVVDTGGDDFHGHDMEIGSHTLTINVLPVNDAPQGHDVSFWLNPGQKVDFIDQYFQMTDVEGDHLKSIVIDALPTYGTFFFGNRQLKVGDEIAIADTDKLSFKADNGLPALGSATLLFSVRDDGGTANHGIDTDTTANTLSFKMVTTPKVVWGTEQDESLTGDAGGNHLYGGAGDDVLFGAGGTDVLHGGSGRDTFVFKNANGDDTIADFDVDQDRIDLSGTSIHSFESLRRHSYQNTADRVLIYSEYKVDSHSHTDYLALEGVNVHDLTEKNFVF
jgi:hypothetical protein